jgi:hypothetical protein
MKASNGVVLRIVYDFSIVMDSNSSFGQRGIVRAYESVEIFGIVFMSSVCTKKFILEEDSYFRDFGGIILVFVASDLDSGYKIFFAVGSEHTEGQLGSSQNNRFVEV